MALHAPPSGEICQHSCLARSLDTILQSVGGFISSFRHLLMTGSLSFGPPKDKSHESFSAEALCGPANQTIPPSHLSSDYRHTATTEASGIAVRAFTSVLFSHILGVLAYWLVRSVSGRSPTCFFSIILLIIIDVACQVVASCAMATSDQLGRVRATTGIPLREGNQAHVANEIHRYPHEHDETLRNAMFGLRLDSHTVFDPPASPRPRVGSRDITTVAEIIDFLLGQMPPC
jgi:hypothetical protein